MNCPHCKCPNHEKDAKFCHVCGTALVEDVQNSHGSGLRLFLRKSGNLYGYVDMNGAVVVEPHFSDARCFSEGYAAVKVDKTWGYIDQRGEMVILPQFNRASGFHEAMASVFDGHYWGFVNGEGALVVPFQYHDAGPYSEGLAPVCKNLKWGFIDNEGRRVIELQFDEAYPFKDGLARVRDGSSKKFGYINHKGKFVIGPSFEQARDFSDGRAFVQYHEGRQGFYCYVDEKGSRSQYCKWDSADDFHEGLACVSVDKEFGYINKKGELVIRPQFDDAASFSEGMAAIKIGNRWGYIDKEGNTTIAPQFLDALPFQGETAAVRDEDGFCLIDKRGVKLAGQLFVQLSKHTRDELDNKFVKNSIRREEERRASRLKWIHHSALIVLAIIASLAEFLTFDSFNGWGWAFVPAGVNLILTVYRVFEVVDVDDNELGFYDFVLSFIPLILINVAAFFFTDAWSFAVLIPILLLSIGLSSYYHYNR